jgi:pimeloyl-ACP methyl ester carboxylesterase
MTPFSDTLRVRAYGASGPAVIVLHGGPGAPGTMAPVARGLADLFRVLEPLQRPSGGESLTVERHIADLHRVVESYQLERPALVGASWGAMLALAYAAAHPDRAGPLVLIGCGTFDPAARARLQSTLEQRMDGALRQRIESLPSEILDPDQRLAALGKLLAPLYSYELTTDDLELLECDARANQEAWRDMVRLQEGGVYPDAFRAITSPVLQLHGAVDPHPGQMIRASLAKSLPQLEYREWERCGHYPWLEKQARQEFFSLLRRWLAGHLMPHPPP